MSPVLLSPFFTELICLRFQSSSLGSSFILRFIFSQDKKQTLSNGTAVTLPLFLEKKLYCSIWRKILTGFSCQKESAQGVQVPSELAGNSQTTENHDPSAITIYNQPTEISDDQKVSIEGNGLCTSVHYKPTDSHSYLLYSSSYPSHVKNSIPYSQFLRRRRLCSDDSDFSLKSEEMCNFFNKRGYPCFCCSSGPS